MLFSETPLAGAFVIDVEKLSDERGFFARTWCREEFGSRGLETRFVQCSLSVNVARGTLRGMHFQAAPHEEVRLVRCVRGAVFDVIVDLRPGSETLHRWFGVELAAASGRQLYVPKGFAHGFQTLEDDTELVYQMATAYCADASRGHHHASPAFGIEWPLPISNISPRDRDLERLPARIV